MGFKAFLGDTEKPCLWKKSFRFESAFLLFLEKFQKKRLRCLLMVSSESSRFVASSGPSGPSIAFEVAPGGVAANSSLLNSVLKMYFVDRLSVRKIAKALGVSHMTVFRMLSDPKVFARVGIR